MLFALLIILLVAGGEVSGTTPKRPPPSQCLSPAARDKVPPLKCGPNSYFERCSKVCPPQNCSSLLDPNWLCESPCCVPECRCYDGYLHHDRTGQCISRDECLAQCGPTERFVKDSTECQMTCANYMVTGPRRICKPFTGCVCGEGRVRLNDDGTGECVLQQKCPRRRCPLNEHLEDCPGVCANETCISKNVKTYKCLLPIIPQPCKPRCICDKGHARNALGICIPENDCYPASYCGSDLEYKKCGSSCAPSCADLDNLNPQPCTEECVEGCFCKDGYVKDDQGNCVTRDKCRLPVCNKPNEVAKECGSYCEIRTCEDYNRTDIVCPAVCVRGCFCRKGYVKNAYNICIPKEKCPRKPVCLQKNEEYQPCGSSCPDTCDNYKDTNRICTKNCVAACNCKAGYVRNLKDGTCIKPEQCPSKECTGKNEVLNLCASYCPMQCVNRFNQGDRRCTTPCRKACDCIQGTVRSDNGTCVSREQCTPPVCRQNEKYKKCGTACPLTCDNYKNPPTCKPQCTEDCFCKDGYVRDRFLRCVKPENCEPICPAGEKFNDCRAHCQDTCGNYNQTDRVCNYDLCRSGCVCEEGTVRRKDGKCVLPSQCPPNPICPVDEVFDPCSAHCEPTCERYEANRPCTDICTPGCKCAGVLLRRKDGKCVKFEECYPLCPENERWEDCRIGLCRALSCDQLGFPIACPGIVGPCRDGGCVCINNWVVPKPNCLASCGNDFNSTVGCGINCGRQCTDYKSPRGCRILQPCRFNGCDCKKGYVYDVVTDRCLAPVDCPIPCNGDVYKEKVKCPNPCAPTCARPTTKICTKACLTEGCQCRRGYILDPNGKCVRPENCPDGFKCNGDPNARVGSCVTLCEPQCGVGPRFCPAYCGLGCACKEGYLLSKNGDKCIKSEECANDTTTESSYEISSPYEEDLSESTGSVDTQAVAEGYAEAQASASDGAQQSTSLASRKLILCPRDEIWINCKAGYCKPQYCRDAYKNLACPKVAERCPGGCICRDGLLRNEDETCIPTNQCPIPCAYDPNAIRRQCASPESCRATCAVPNPNVCPKVCIINGCECKKGYVLSAKGGKCIRIQECPRGNVTCNGDHHADITAFPQACPSTCALPNGIPNCLKLGLDVGCKCKAVYLKSTDNGKCIPASQCKGGDPCGAHETFSSCRFTCADIYCPVDDRRGIISCGNPRPCPSGCNCIPNYRRRSKEDERCILASTCPPVNCTRPSEIWHPCPACLRENCEDVNNQPTTCNTLVYNCKPQCVCKKGHFRNNKGICVPAKDCPGNQPCDDQNAERLKCAPAPSCQPTCERPNPSPCILSCGINQCVCKKGFVLSAKGGKCITADQCPKDAPCNGDSNAVIKVNPIPCPSTCRAPNASPWCKKYAPPVGCECKPGFLLADNSGKCIKPNECPGGNPCGANSTFVWCRVSCPNDYCPVDDNRAIIACDPPYPCPNGCVCNLNYKRKSIEDETVCVLSSTCPRVNCTRPNEIWDSCRSDCLRERCADVNNQPTTCNTLVLNCQPQCVCKKGYFRNDSDICVPENECPGYQYQPCKDQNAERSKCAPAPSCRSTCSKPNPSPCILSCAVNQCVCKKGYVLSSEKGGKCIPVDQCPKDSPCNGDSNAVIKANPIPCPSTCGAPNASPWCKKYAPPVGCECKPGFLLTEDGGKCIEPDKCPGGNPCGKNGTFAWCNFNCPTNTCPVSDTRAIIACSPPYPCPNGCACKVNYKRRSSSDLTCILASDCPAVNCTRPNEMWSHCPSACLRERCTDKDAPPTSCSTLVPNCQPKCICKKGYYRDDTDICIPANECGIQCKANEVYKKCRINCPPQTCASIYTDYDCRNATKCEPGCDCINEYLRNGTENDLCIPSSQCPTTPPVIPDCGINEHYESNRNKCELTCKNYKLEHIMGPCQLTSGCFCDKGFVKNDNGMCIPKEKCPQNIVCPKNEVVSQCYNTCHKTCDTRLRSDGRMCQLACINTGCLCIEGYLRHKNGTCVPISQCSPPRCNENEIYSSCGSACPATCQNRGDNCTACTAQCVEDCFCKKGFVRADDGTCMKPKDCPPRTCSDANEVMDPCPPTCPPTDGCSNIWSKFNCTNAIKCCKPQCRCKSGYFRKDKCVPSSQC